MILSRAVQGHFKNAIEQIDGECREESEFRELGNGQSGLGKREAAAGNSQSIVPDPRTLTLAPPK